MIKEDPKERLESAKTDYSAQVPEFSDEEHAFYKKHFGQITAAWLNEYFPKKYRDNFDEWMSAFSETAAFCSSFFNALDAARTEGIPIEVKLPEEGIHEPLFHIRDIINGKISPQKND